MTEQETELKPNDRTRNWIKNQMTEQETELKTKWQNKKLN